MTRKHFGIATITNYSSHCKVEGCDWVSDDYADERTAAEEAIEHIETEHPELGDQL